MKKIVNIFKKTPTKNLEIERKFLLSNIPNINYNDELLIYQFYVNVNGIINRFRETRNIKSQDSIYQYFIKIPLSHNTFQETEISYDDFQNMRKNEIGNILKKKFIYIENNFKYEINDYLNLKLITLKVEPININVEQNIIIPTNINDYIITEITNNKLFSNHILSQKK